MAPSTSDFGLYMIVADDIQPCCVCKDEKAARDECMLFSTSNNAQQECQSLVEQYRSCMKGYGFNIP